jgi:hypothetical protein
MNGKVEQMNGGLLATFMAMAFTYASGWLLTATGWLSDAWARVTPGQAALMIGLLTYATHNAPKLCKWLAALRRREAHGTGPLRQG